MLLFLPTDSVEEALTTYWADKGIRVNCITPGGVESGQNEEFKKNILPGFLLEEWGDLMKWSGRCYTLPQTLPVMSPG